ncbi:hypothetical protein [Sphingobacterium multivorum]|uniref:hypothetical protein n=1 Tax=Sphingobacterium multivorum TaxID=28454 RepID=UPI000E9830AF|nr:hypothetical protein [Sphingobacterium multivorum]HBI89297.1 hypothetical protein [Sphingobacterium sp.]
MAHRFVEVFRENVPIAVRLQDLLKYVEKARELKCYEMRIVVSFDPANPGINLIFGRLILNDRLKAGGFFPDFDHKVHVIPGIDMSDKSSMGEFIQQHISDAFGAPSLMKSGWLKIAKEIPEIKRQLFLNYNPSLDPTWLEHLSKEKSQKEFERKYLSSPIPEEPEKLNDKNGKTNNNRR